MIFDNNYIDLSKTNDRLYKYTAIEHIPSTLENGIYAGRIEDLNDPYESKDIKDCDRYRICSLSRSQNANLMWSHYARAHKGCCLVVRYDGYGSPMSLLRRVNYEHRYIKRQGLHSDDKMVESLYHKDYKWENELEVRAVFCKGFSDTSYWNILDNDKIFLKARITTINFGCLADLDSNHYYDALRAIYQHNLISNAKIKVQKMRMKDDEYRFVIDKKYSFESELERLGIAKELVRAG